MAYFILIIGLFGGGVLIFGIYGWSGNGLSVKNRS